MDPTEESFVAQVREASVAQVTHPACEPRCETAREVRRSPSFMELTEDLLFLDQRAIKQCECCMVFVWILRPDVDAHRCMLSGDS